MLNNGIEYGKNSKNNQQFNISLFIIIFALPNDSTFNANGF